MLDAVGVLCEYAEAYPAVPPEAWEPYRALYPENFAGDSWRLPCLSYLVRSEGVTVLVDTGVGPPGLWDWTAEDEGLLPGVLEAAGVGLDQIDVVFLTHLDIDHLGWNTDLDGVPLFPRARYVVHADALAFALTRDVAHIRRCVVPLADAFVQVRGDVEIAPGVVAFEAPGHSPGHMALRVGLRGLARDRDRRRRAAPGPARPPRVGLRVRRRTPLRMAPDPRGSVAELVAGGRPRRLRPLPGKRHWPPGHAARDGRLGARSVSNRARWTGADGAVERASRLEVGGWVAIR